MLIEFDTDYMHNGNHKLYRVREKLHVKQPDGSWAKGVKYERADADFNGPSWVRTDKNFVERFTPIAVGKDDE